LDRGSARAVGQGHGQVSVSDDRLGNVAERLFQGPLFFRDGNGDLLVVGGAVDSGAFLKNLEKEP